MLRFLIGNPPRTMALAAVVFVLVFGAPNLLITYSPAYCDYFGVGGMRTIYLNEAECPVVKLLPIPWLPWGER